MAVTFIDKCSGNARIASIFLSSLDHLACNGPTHTVGLLHSFKSQREKRKRRFALPSPLADFSDSFSSPPFYIHFLVSSSSSSNNFPWNSPDVHLVRCLTRVPQRRPLVARAVMCRPLLHEHFQNGYGSCEITDLIDSPLISPIAKLLEVCRQISNWNWRETEKYLRYIYGYWWITYSQNGCTQPCSVCIIYLLCLYSCSICSCSPLFSVWLPSTFVISSTIIHPSASFLPLQSLYVAMGESVRPRDRQPNSLSVDFFLFSII